VLDHWQEVFQTLRRNRLRTFLTACGVFWGVFMLVVMLGFGRGLENGVVRGFRNWAFNSVMIWTEVTALPHAGRQPGRRIQLTMDDAEAVRRRVDGIELVVPRNWGGGWGGSSAVGRKDKTEGFNVVAGSVDDLRLEALPIEAGRFLDPLDVSEVRKVAVIGARVRDVLFAKNEDPVGASIKVSGTEMTVVGVFRSPAPGEQGDWSNGRVFVPRSTFARINGLGPRVDALTLLVAPERSAADVETEAKALLKMRQFVAPDDNRAIRAFNLSKEFGKIQLLFRSISALTWIVGLLTLFAGALGVSNIMMIAVAERTREIGIRKALGATPSSIVAQIVTEATVLTSLAGYTGLVAGVALVEGIARLMAGAAARGPQLGMPELDIGKALIAAVVLTVAGALAGLAPARSAVAVRPVEALAHE